MNTSCFDEIKLEGDNIQSVDGSEDTIERLDKRYMEQIKHLQNMLLHMMNSDITRLCYKWLKVFKKVGNNEKKARNYLSDLMAHQLHLTGNLGEPFLDRNNLNCDLGLVLANYIQKTQKKEIPNSIGLVTSNTQFRNHMKCRSAREESSKSRRIEDTKTTWSVPVDPEKYKNFHNQCDHQNQDWEIRNVNSARYHDQNEEHDLQSEESNNKKPFALPSRNDLLDMLFNYQRELSKRERENAELRKCCGALKNSDYNEISAKPIIKTLQGSSPREEPIPRIERPFPEVDVKPETPGHKTLQSSPPVQGIPENQLQKKTDENPKIDSADIVRTEMKDPEQEKFYYETCVVNNFKQRDPNLTESQYIANVKQKLQKHLGIPSQTSYQKIEDIFHEPEGQHDTIGHENSNHERAPAPVLESEQKNVGNEIAKCITPRSMPSTCKDGNQTSSFESHYKSRIPKKLLPPWQHLEKGILNNDIGEETVNQFDQATGENLDLVDKHTIIMFKEFEVLKQELEGHKLILTAECSQTSALADRMKKLEAEIEEIEKLDPIESIKEILEKNVETALKRFDEIDLKEKVQFLETIFMNLIDEKDVLEEIKTLDICFETAVNKLVDNEITRTKEEVFKLFELKTLDYEKDIEQKYEARKLSENLVHGVNIHLVKMQCFKKFKSSFHKRFKGTPELRKEVFDYIKLKYEKIMRRYDT